MRDGELARGGLTALHCAGLPWAAGIAMGLVMLGSASDKAIDELLAYALMRAPSRAHALTAIWTSSWAGTQYC